MSRNKDEKDDEKDKGPRRAGRIGFGRPPIEHRFKPGQSGNPKGRPKKKQDEAAMLEMAKLVMDEAGRPVTARIGDKTVTLPALEAMLRNLMKQALQGDRHAQSMILKLFEKAEQARAQPGGLTGPVIQRFAIPDNGRDTPPADEGADDQTDDDVADDPRGGPG